MAPCLQVLDALVDRLKDPEEKVRASAVAAICEAATADLQACWTSTWPCLLKDICNLHDHPTRQGAWRKAHFDRAFLLS